MKRIWILAGAVLAAALLAPGGEGDVGDLIPVELLYVYSENGGVGVETDSGQWGTGADLREALADLKAAAPGEVFLETADYLIVNEAAAELLPELTEILRPAARVCIGQRPEEGAADFLAAHKPETTLNDVRAGGAKLPVLISQEGRYEIGA